MRSHFKTLRVELANPTKQARWQQRIPAMAAGLTDHVWTQRKLLTEKGFSPPQAAGF